MKSRYERALDYLQKEIDNRKLLRKQARLTIQEDDIYNKIDKKLKEEINLIDYIKLVVRRYK